MKKIGEEEKGRLMTLPTDKQSVSFGVKEKNRELELSRMIAFWELRYEILGRLSIAETQAKTEYSQAKHQRLIEKIESI